MSGLALELRYEGAADIGTMERMLRRLAHRGEPRLARGSPSVLLGLASTPTLPQDDDAPTIDGRERAIVFHGRLDERETLERWLDAEPSTSDAGLVLGAWARAGPDALDRLQGSFAFILWDAPDASVVLARDRLGTKPLFLARTPGGMRAASEPYALFVDSASRPRPNLRALALALVEEPGPPGETLIEGAEAFPPGHVMIVARGTARLQKFGALDTMRSTAAPTLARAADLLDVELRRAVRESMRARGRVAIWVSGGLDSTTIAALAAQEARSTAAPPPLLATTAYPALPCDETRSARRVAAHLGLDLVEVDAPSDPSAFEPSGPPDLLFQPFQPVWVEMARALGARGVSTHIMGLGSDESQWRTGFECETAILEGRWADAAVHAGLHDRPWSRPAWRRLAKGVLRMRYTSDLRERLLGARWGEAEWIPSWCTRAAAEWIRSGRAARRDALRELHRRDIVKEIHATWLVGGQAGPRMLEHVDLLGASSGIEQRSPFFDRGVVELLLSLPARLTSPRRLSKPVLRELARRHLPPDIAERPVKTTTDAFLGRALAVRTVETRHLLAESALERLGLAKVGALLTLLDHGDRDDHLLELTTAISLEVWARAWGFA